MSPKATTTCTEEGDPPPKKLNLTNSSMCHQCQRNDKGEVVRCQKCKRKRFCFPCMNTCDHSIVDLHRTCPTCSFDLCLACCPESRLQGGREVITEYTSRGREYLNNEEATSFKAE